MTILKLTFTFKNSIWLRVVYKEQDIDINQIERAGGGGGGRGLLLKQHYMVIG